MGRNLLALTVLPIFLMVVGCEQNRRPQAAVAEPVNRVPLSTTMTLSAEQLMALDWNGREVDRSMILDKRVAGAGVELDIRFPGNTVGLCAIDHTSSGAAGQRTLVGLDVAPYEAFALKFSLISVNAHCDPNVPLEVAAGAVVGPSGDGRVSAYEPVLLGLAADRATAVATTPMHTRTIRVIGIHVHVVDPLAWDTSGGILTIRVEPAPDAEILPMPSVASPEAGGGKTAGASGRKTHTKSPSISTFGTKRIGAW